jgi:hypothetical protein
MSLEQFNEFSGLGSMPHPAGDYDLEMYAGRLAPFVAMPNHPDVPLYLDDMPFHNLDFLRAWADARNCDLYSDSIIGEPVVEKPDTRPKPGWSKK